MELGVGHLALVVEMDGDLGVALDAGDRVDDDLIVSRVGPSCEPKRCRAPWDRPAVAARRAGPTRASAVE